MITMNTNRYRRLVAALEAVRPDPMDGALTDAIKIVLGEIGDVWPSSIFDDVAGDEEE